MKSPPYLKTFAFWAADGIATRSDLTDSRSQRSNKKLITKPESHFKLLKYATCILNIEIIIPSDNVSALFQLFFFKWKSEYYCAEQKQKYKNKETRTWSTSPKGRWKSERTFCKIFIEMGLYHSLLALYIFCYSYIYRYY